MCICSVLAVCTGLGSSKADRRCSSCADDYADVVPVILHAVSQPESVLPCFTSSQLLGLAALASLCLSIIRGVTQFEFESCQNPTTTQRLVTIVVTRYHGNSIEKKLQISPE